MRDSQGAIPREVNGSLEWRRGEYLITTDRGRLDLAAVHRFLAEGSYWAAGIPFETVRRSVEHSLPFGIYHGEALIGFARIITDFATFAYVGDVYVEPAHRGRGLSKWLMATIAAHPDLQGFRRWILATRDAHGLYAQCGFTPLEHPDTWMEMRPVRAYSPGSGPLAAPSGGSDRDRA